MSIANKPENQKAPSVDQRARGQAGEAAEPVTSVYNGLTARQRRVITLQRTVGNRAVQRLLGTETKDGLGWRADGDTGEDNSPPQPFALREWPNKLPTVNRGPTQKITKVKDKLELNVPDMPAVTLTDPQKDALKQINDNRTNLPAPLEKVKETAYTKNKGTKSEVTDSKAGYIYNGGGSNTIKPAGSGQAADDSPAGKRKAEVMAAVHKEIGHEGGWSAVNTYDDAVVTLGAGFTRAMLAKVMQTWFARDTEVKNAFLDVGVTWENGTARVVNGQSGGIEEGDNALRLIELQPAILSLFVTMAESEEHGKTLATVEDQVIMGSAGNVPQSVIDDTSWSLNAIRLVAHLIQWRSAKNWANYQGCGGNVKEILKVVAPHLGSVDAARGNARVLNQEQSGVLFRFAEGKAKEGLDSASSAALDTEIPADSLKGVMLLMDTSTTFFRVTL